MSTLKNYSKLSKASYKSIRTFASSNQRPNTFRPETSNSNIGSNTVNRQDNSATNNPDASPFAVAQAVAETGANLASYALRGLAENATNLASGKTSGVQSQQANNERARGTSEKRIEHFTSTDTRFNAFSSAGHVSGFGAPWKRNDFGSRPNVIKGDLNQSSIPGEILNQVMGQTFYAVGSILNNVVNVATTVANDMNARNRAAPGSVGGAGTSRSRSTDTISRRDQNYVNYGERPTQNANQASGSNNNNPIGSFVNSVAQGVSSNIASSAFQGVVNTAVNTAAGFIPGAQNVLRQNSNPGQTIESAVRGAANVAQGFVNTATSIASNFVPGAQNTQSRNPSPYSSQQGNVQNQNSDFMYRGSQVEDLTFTDANKQGKVPGSKAEEILDQAKEYATTAGAVAKDVAGMAASGLSDFSRKTSKAAGSAANNFVTAAGSAALSAASQAARGINAAATAPEGTSDFNQSFIYTGSQVQEELLFHENKKADRKSPHPVYDVVISGGGPAGAALACALGHYRYFSKEDKKIILLDPKEPPSLDKFADSNVLPEHRVVSLSLASVDFLQEMGVWSLLNRDRIGSVHQMQVWESGGNSFIKFNEKPAKEIGYVVEVAHLQAAIFERIKALGNIKIETPNKITDLRNETNDFATVVLDDEYKISARLVVGSDGANSLVKKKSKIGSTGWNSLQHGIVCTVKTPYRNTTAWQRFLSTGPLAVLPLWDEYSSIVWSCENDLFGYLMQASDEEFLKELNYNLTRRPLYNTPNLVFSPKATFDLPPPITEVCNKRLSFPLSMQQANQFVAPRVALVGDAAHNIHPLAGQGLNLGLTDSAYLANVIVKNLKSGNDIGSQDHLREYEGASMSINTTMMYGLEFIKRSYEANDNGVTVNLRNLTTSTINNFSPLKSWFIDAANGKYSQPSDYEWNKL